ncbi:MAG: NifB/NifX family molybdenum-iron cluster-binding protein [Anaerolineae bacterium]|jgi:predicted Fe-Mo cluster-binding NifX family protein
MKIAVSSTAPGLEAQVSPIFGRCACFVVVDAETQEAVTLENPALGAAGGAGIQSAQHIVRQGVGAVISGNVGPNALQVLQAAGIAVYAATGGTVGEAVAALQAGELEALSQPSVAKDFGKGGGGGGRGLGRGMGGGAGRGRGL